MKRPLAALLCSLACLVSTSASAAVIASFERTRNTWSAGDTTLVSRLLAVTQTPEQRASR